MRPQRKQGSNPMSDARDDAAARPMTVVMDELGYAVRFLRNHGWKLLSLFACLLLPVWGFAALVGEVHEKEAFAFDAPLLNALHSMQTPGLDHFFVDVSRVGFLWGTIPIDVLLLIWLAARRRFRDSLFFFLAVAGSGVLDFAGKLYFHRDRPDLWLSITPESSYSFPSGHAMGSATLAMAVVLLCWRTRWRWLALAGALGFVLLVGTSRVYLGVHYPSDILAGWSAAIAWVYGMFVLIDRKAPPPPTTAATGSESLGAPA